MNQEIILAEVRAAGVPDPLRATAETIRAVLEAHLTRRTLSHESLSGYLLLLNPSLQTIVDGLKAFSLDQAGLSHKTQDAIRLAIDTLGARLARPNVSEFEAHQLRLSILELVRESRAENDQQRVLTLGFATLATSAFLAAVGGVLALMESRRQGGGAGGRLALRGSPPRPGRLLLK